MPASATVDSADNVSHRSLSIANGAPPADYDSPAGDSSDDDSNVTPGVFPLLRDDATDDSLPPGSRQKTLTSGAGDGIDEDEPAVAKPFPRKTGPRGPGRKGPKAEDGDDDDGTPPPGAAGAAGNRKIHKMHKFSLYETASRYYIVGGDVAEKRFRILKIDRNEDGELGIADDKTVYSRKEMSQLLDTIDDGNRGTGGIRLRCTMWGLLGFIRFTGPYYMLLITKKSTAAMIGGHFVYQINGTEMIPLVPAEKARYKPDHRSDEGKYLNSFHGLDLNKHFYYSYSYDITHTLQHNITREREAMTRGELHSCDDDFNSMFLWNSHLLEPALKDLSSPFDWYRPVIHGCINQSSIDVYGRTAYITLIARRSRFFAGARFLKRGANDLGYVANDVETEQIVSEVNTTSFHAPGPKLFASPQYTSHVQHRGSIPLFWSQDNTGVTPKPPIEMNLIEPFYGAASMHFDNLFERYGAPVYVLNLVKAKERTPRETKLLEEYTRCITYLNQFLPEGKKIVHHAWDMSRASKARDLDVIEVLEGIAEGIMVGTGFFQNGDGHISPPRVQNGVARTNCIDCLDRTNAAQFVVGKVAAGHQLHALGILSDTSVKLETDAMILLTNMYHELGDSIAMQYAGSQLVNTMETYRKINQWSSHSRDMLESFKRYYNNSFMDRTRQEAYNLFLGNYIHTQGQPMLWDLATDHHLHQRSPKLWIGTPRRDYIHWYTAKHLEERTMPPYVRPRQENADKPTAYFDEYWLEYYRPFSMSSFVNMFPYRMNSTIKSIPFKFSQDGRYDLSPFRVRNEGDQAVQDRKKTKKEVVVLAPHDVARLAGVGAAAGPDNDDAASVMSGRSGAGRGLRGWLQPGADKGSQGSIAVSSIQSILKDAGGGVDALPAGAKPSSLEKSHAAQLHFARMVHKSLNPSVHHDETDDYARYIRHPQNLPLVVSADADAADENGAEYRDYVAGGWQTESAAVAPGADEDFALYAELLRVEENPLTVGERDVFKKRYKAYGKWLRGKSLFKQVPVD